MLTAIRAVVGVFFVVHFCHGQPPPPFSYQFFQSEIGGFRDEEANWMCFVFGVCSTVFGQQSGLTPVYQWSQLEFDYPSANERRADIDRGNFVPGKPAPIDVDVHYSFTAKQRNRVFITIPRFQQGVPVTLGVVSDRKFGQDNNPIIKPYPSWEWHTNPRRCKKDRIVSVYRVQIDECQRLWVLDTGKLEEDQICPPQLLAFDLQTNQLVHRYQIPSNMYETRSILVTPIVDVRDAHHQCRDTFVYMADVQAYSMLVYDVQKRRSWRVSDKTMYPYPTYGTFDILGDSFDLMDGVLGMSLSPFRPGEDRKLFYHAMASPTENWVYTSDLRNQSRFMHDPASSPEIFYTLRGERKTQSAAEAIDRDGVMYFGLMSDVSLDCWDTKSDQYSPEKVAKDTETLQFASGVKVVTNSDAQQELWVMTSRFQKIATDTLRPSEVNFRVQMGRTESLGSRCKRSGNYGSYHHGTTTHGGGYGLYTPVSTHYTSVQSATTKKYNSY